MSAKLLFLSGSSRKESTNKKLALAAYNIAIELGADAQFVDLKDYPMPIYDGDLEAESGLPESAKKLKKIFVDSDAIFIASPEYNSSFSALLKNSIDWISRPHEEGEPQLAAFRNKTAAIGSASPGGLGGLRGLVPLRMLLGNILMLVIPEQLALGNAFSAFDTEGKLNNEANQAIVTSMVKTMMSKP